MHCRYYLHGWNRDSCIISIKIVTHIFAAETFTCINAAETSNCIIATETVTCIIATKRSTNINVAESTTNIIAIEPQNLHNCNRRWHLHNCYRKCQLHSSNRNCHQQNWLQKISLAEMMLLKVSQTKGQIDIPLWTHVGHKKWSEDGKKLTRCCTIASKI